MLHIADICILYWQNNKDVAFGGRSVTKAVRQVAEPFEEAVHGIRIIKAFHARDYVNDRFDKVNEIHRKEIKKVLNRQELASPLSEFLGITIAAGILFYGGWLQVQGKLGMGWPAFVVYIGFYWRVLEPAKSISKAYAMIRKGMVSANAFFNCWMFLRNWKKKVTMYL